MCTESCPTITLCAPTFRHELHFVNYCPGNGIGTCESPGCFSACIFYVPDAILDWIILVRFFEPLRIHPDRTRWLIEDKRKYSERHKRPVYVRKKNFLRFVVNNKNKKIKRKFYFWKHTKPVFVGRWLVDLPTPATAPRTTFF